MILTKREESALFEGERKTIKITNPAKRRRVLARDEQTRKNLTLFNFERFFRQLDRLGCTADDLRHMRKLLQIIEDRVATETTLRIGGKKATATRRRKAG